MNTTKGENLIRRSLNLTAEESARDRKIDRALTKFVGKTFGDRAVILRVDTTLAGVDAPLTGVEHDTASGIVAVTPDDNEPVIDLYVMECGGAFGGCEIAQGFRLTRDDLTLMLARTPLNEGDETA
jgi:hypothetical protein